MLSIALQTFANRKLLVYFGSWRYYFENECLHTACRCRSYLTANRPLFKLCIMLMYQVFFFRKQVWLHHIWMRCVRSWGTDQLDHIVFFCFSFFFCLYMHLGVTHKDVQHLCTWIFFPVSKESFKVSQLVLLPRCLATLDLQQQQNWEVLRLIVRGSTAEILKQDKNSKFIRNMYIYLYLFILNVLIYNNWKVQMTSKLAIITRLEWHLCPINTKRLSFKSCDWDCKVCETSWIFWVMKINSYFLRSVW